MPIPSSFTDLDENPNNNSPMGSEAVGPNANGYIQALGAFIRQMYDGALKPLATVNFNAQKLTNLAAGTVSSTSKDAVNGAQLQAVYKVGEVKIWHGFPVNLATVWGPGWQVCDGTNGTADLRDKFVVGQGGIYTLGQVGGSNSAALAIVNLPPHNHGVSDGGHNHSTNDGGHGHTVNDGGHNHASATFSPFLTNDGAGSGIAGSGPSRYGSANTTAASVTGISVNPSNSAISNNPAVTGISTQNTGSGTPVDIRPPYFAMCFIEYTGIGA